MTIVLLWWVGDLAYVIGRGRQRPHYGRPQHMHWADQLQQVAIGLNLAQMPPEVRQQLLDELVPLIATMRQQ